jgi:hypothetical protein
MGSGHRGFEVKRRAHLAKRAAIEQLLTGQELFEYDLRESAISQRLALSGFAFSEAEFRAVYQIVATSAPDKAGAAPAPNRLIASDHEPALRSALGDRFEEFMRSQDANYQLLAAIGVEHGVDASAIDDAYDIVRSAEERVEKLRLMGPLTRDAKTREQILLERDAQLSGLLDGAALDAVMRMIEVRGRDEPSASLVAGGLR